MDFRHWQLDASVLDLARPKPGNIKSSLAEASEFWRDDEDGEVRAGWKAMNDDWASRDAG